MADGIMALPEDVAYLVNHEKFSETRAYRALALCDSREYGDPQLVFITERGETIFVATSQCLAIEADRYSTSWPNAYRSKGRRKQ